MADYSDTTLALFFIFYFVGLLFIVYLLLKTIRVVKHSEVVIIERWGKYYCTLKPGLHFINPITMAPRTIHWRYINVDSGNNPYVVREVQDRIDMREHVIDFARRYVITKDTVEIQIDALVYYRITDPRSAVYRIQNLPDAIELLTQATLRDIIASLTLDETFSSREKINARLLDKVCRDAERWGVSINRVEIVNIVPPYDINEAMERQIKEERERRSLIITADGTRESDIIKSKGDAAKLVLEATGDKQSTIERAIGQASGRAITAEAEAASIKAVQTALQNSGIRAADYLAAVDYLNALKTLTDSGKGVNLTLVPGKAVETMHDIFKRVAVKSA